MARLTNAEKVRRYKERVKQKRLEEMSRVPGIAVSSSGIPYYQDPTTGMKLAFVSIQGKDDGNPPG